MDQFIKNLEERMLQQFQLIALESQNPLQQAQRSFDQANVILSDLKETLKEHVFKDYAEEISFFKEIKPRFQRELFYFEELYHLEANKPHGTELSVREYYTQVMERIKTFFENNRTLYNYHLSAETTNDELYFTRQGHYVWPQPVVSIDMDLKFSTPFSSRLAKLLAFEQLREYLNNKLTSPTAETASNQLEKIDKLVWTDQNVDIAEVIYVIWKKGSVNFGNATLKQIVAGIEEAFNINLGNFYQIIKNLRMRKKDRFAYLRKAIHTGEEKMDETDLNF